MTPLDIAIAGCGPCGLASALLLSRDGHRVTLFERFDAPRPIGSGLMLQPTGLAVLAKLGLADRAIAQGARVTRLLGKTPSGRTILDVSYAALRRPGAHGVGIHRAALFGILHDAVSAAGIAIETGRTIAAAPFSGTRRTLHFADGTQAGPFDLIVDTLGSHSPLAPPTGRALAYGALWASLDWHDDGFDDATLEQRYHAARRMVGVLPIGTLSEPGPGQDQRQAAFFWSLRADQYVVWRAAGLDRWKTEVRALWPATAPLLDQIIDPDQLTFARYAHRTLPRPVEAAMIHIGDAWHSASPQLGQGANMALLDAYALAMALREASRVEEALAYAAQLRSRHIRLYQALTALLTPVYQSDGHVIPFARDWLVGPLSRVRPIQRLQAALVSGLVGDPLKPLALTV